MGRKFPTRIEPDLAKLWRALHKSRLTDATLATILRTTLDYFGTDVMLMCGHRTYNVINKRVRPGNPSEPCLFISTYDGTPEQLAALVGRRLNVDLINFGQPLAAIVDGLAAGPPDTLDVETQSRSFF